MSVLLVLGCLNVGKNDGGKKDSPVAQVKVDRSLQEHESEKKSISQRKIAVVFFDDTINFNERDIYLAQKTIPQFSEDLFLDPDQAYASRGMGYQPQTREESEFNRFGCEVCQDDYYLMYAYFLRRQTGETKHFEERKTLISIFRLINALNEYLKNGGTYFAHQYQKLYAYAEYAVYVYSRDYDDENKYPVAKVKSFFIGELKQKVLDDEIYNFDGSIGAVEKKKRKEELLKIVDQINRLITNHFYLHEAQKFQYTKY